MNGIESTNSRKFSFDWFILKEFIHIIQKDHVVVTCGEMVSNFLTLRTILSLVVAVNQDPSSPRRQFAALKQRVEGGVREGWRGDVTYAGC